MRLRYVARIDDGCAASLLEVPADSALGRLSGPENIFVFRTERYAHHPLVVSGPGAGPQVTAGGAFADLIKVARAIVGTT
jgi:aspartokinase/homoserine dehydrogenase 1